MNLRKASLWDLLVISRFDNDKDAVLAAYRELRRRIALGCYEPTENDYLSGLQSGTEKQKEHCEGDRPSL